MPSSDPATATANSQRKNSCPSSYGPGSATSSCSSARGSSGAGRIPFPCLPVDSATSCSTQRPKPAGFEVRPTLAADASRRPSSSPGFPSAKRQASRISTARSSSRVARGSRRCASASRASCPTSTRRGTTSAQGRCATRVRESPSDESCRARGTAPRRTRAAPPPVRATSHPSRARRRRRSRRLRRRRSRTPEPLRAAPASAAARRASRATAPRRRRSRRSGPAPKSARRGPSRRSRRCQDLALLRDAALQLFERIAELLHALALQRPRYVVVVEPRLAEVVEQLARLVETLLERVGYDAVVLERHDRLLRHRVDGVRADQLLDVEHVSVCRVLRRRRGPEAALQARALRRERVPAVA